MSSPEETPKEEHSAGQETVLSSARQRIVTIFERLSIVGVERPDGDQMKGSASFEIPLVLTPERFQELTSNLFFDKLLIAKGLTNTQRVSVLNSSERDEIYHAALEAIIGCNCPEALLGASRFDSSKLISAAPIFQNLYYGVSLDFSYPVQTTEVLAGVREMVGVSFNALKPQQPAIFDRTIQLKVGGQWNLEHQPADIEDTEANIGQIAGIFEYCLDDLTS